MARMWSFLVKKYSVDLASLGMGGGFPGIGNRMGRLRSWGRQKQN